MKTRDAQSTLTKPSQNLPSFVSSIGSAQKKFLYLRDSFPAADLLARQRKSLHYYYRSPADYSVVKPFYLDYFSRNGWTLTREKENGWGPDALEFKKSPYRIIISHGGLGDADYAMDCDKLSDSGEPLPNKSLDRSHGKRLSHQA